MMHCTCAPDWGMVVVYGGLFGAICLVIGKLLSDAEHKKPPQG